MMQIKVGLGSLSLVVLWSSVTLAIPATEQSTLPIEQQVTEVVRRLEGTLILLPAGATTASESQPTVQMTSCIVHMQPATAFSVPGAVFLYQEQSADNQPYRQRFLRIAPTSDGNAVESLSFRPHHPESWVGLCQQPAMARVVAASDVEDSHCRVVLRQIAENYVGGTPPEGCPSRYRGAVRVTNHIILSPTGMTTFDQGFDTEGNLVWGSQGEPYQFRRIDAAP
ncbi:MAG: chromophore lyase CpcT/CpeT [Synechococcales cyanobacterium M58_A2018_015]|nr:chromophore lyase CpcT/CpeT [Synechococcales cyanobacterium M58_A2018_015]